MFVSVDDRVVAVVASIASEQHRGDIPDITLESRLIEDVGLDSVRLLQLTAALEVEFELEPVGEWNLVGIHTVADLGGLVAMKVDR